MKDYLSDQLQQIREAGLFKGERVITSPQRARVGVLEHEPVLNLCANNYLGLADHPEVIAAAHEALDRWGYGMASVRFICGTQQIHKQLEAEAEPIPRHRGHDPLFLLLRRQRRAVRDAFRRRGRHHLRRAEPRQHHRRRAALQGPAVPLQEQRHGRPGGAAASRRPAPASASIATDGVFSMDGIIANLAGICELADKYDALVMVDDSHAVGFMGKHGRGTPEYHGVHGPHRHPHRHAGQGPGRSQRRLHQRAEGNHRPACASEAGPICFPTRLAPPIVAASMKTLDLLSRSTELRDRLESNTQLFREGMAERGFRITPGVHPICPIMLGDAALAGRMAEAMLRRGVYVVGFSYPVVPKDKARIRVQVSAAHTPDDLAFAMEAFYAAKMELGIE